MKSKHFLPIKDTISKDQFEKLYVREIVRLHGLPRTIILDRDMRFVLSFWRNFNKSLGTTFLFSTIYHS